MAQELSRSLSKFYPHISFQMIQVNSNRIGTMFKHKDKIPKNLTSQVVYKFCNDASYVEGLQQEPYKSELPNTKEDPIGRT